MSGRVSTVHWEAPPILLRMMVSWTPEMDLDKLSTAVVAQIPSRLSVASEEEEEATEDGRAF